MHFSTKKDVECGGVRNICRWSKEVNLIKDNIKKYGKNKKRNRPKKSWFDKMEKRLNDLIQNKAGKVSNEWIKNKAIELNKEIYPNRNFSASNGWLNNFKQRQLQ